jgi:hypothetical protein
MENKHIIYPGRSTDISEPVVKEKFTDFDIDLVYTWVDGDDAEHLKKRKKWQNILHGRGATSTIRFSNNGELRYSMRSVYKFLPWIKHIYIITDGQRPPWLNTDHNRIRIVDHKEVFKDHSCLPSFSSNAIEANIDNIEGLSEYFIYMNDDCFINKLQSKRRFFSEDGKCIIYTNRQNVSKDGISRKTPPHKAALRNSNKLLDQQFIREGRKKVIHQAIPCLKSVIKYCKKVFVDQIYKNCKSKFRSNDSLAMTNLLYPYASIYMNKGKRLTHISQIFSSLNSNMLNNAVKLQRIENENPDFFCFNDMIRGNRETVIKQFNSFLGEKFTSQAPWEM